MFMILAALIAVELKKLKAVWKYIPFIILMVAVFLAKKYVHEFEW
jgi:hypothetical protein